MPNFSRFTDQEIVAYVVNQYSELDAGEPDVRLAESLLADIGHGALAIEKNEDAFVIVAMANRKHKVPFIQIAPEADLIFLYVAPAVRSKGSGAALLAQVQSKYMEDQAMILVCAGDRRKRFFEKAGFVSSGLTCEGLHFMVCPAKAIETNS